nr:Obg-like ATPase 1 [Tanacetum cinerariifolium]
MCLVVVYEIKLSVTADQECPVEEVLLLLLIKYLGRNLMTIHRRELQWNPKHLSRPLRKQLTEIVESPLSYKVIQVFNENDVVSTRQAPYEVRKRLLNFIFAAFHQSSEFVAILKVEYGEQVCSYKGSLVFLLIKCINVATMLINAARCQYNISTAPGKLVPPLYVNVKAWLESEKDIRLRDWKAAEIEILNVFQLLAAKPVIYLTFF